jgi:Tol biopolymer transport system component
VRALVLGGIAALALAVLGVGLAARGDGRSECAGGAGRDRAVSPDGARSAVARCTSEGAWLFVTERGQERPVVPRDWGCCYRPSRSVVFREPAWAPDGRRLAVVIDDVGGTDVWVVDVDRGSARRVTAGPARERGPRWSSDGRRIVFSTEGGGVGSAAVHAAAPPG